ncbi:MAG: hypothetical protein KME20_08105 [Kaiparowitsia implicata GSE-PSE-MK54-09C]|jgi:hypothetical protein|nr:hypothetical protein [Kaiparowitsia implicata GSE-PSE-MK54-09C]
MADLQDQATWNALNLKATQQRTDYSPAPAKKAVLSWQQALHSKVIVSSNTY